MSGTALTVRLPTSGRLEPYPPAGPSPYPELIAGDGYRHSHALLGILDAIAPAAAAALTALDAGDVECYRAILGPTVPLSRHIFEAPTFNYKASIAFLAWLNGHQPVFRVLGELEGRRSLEHYAGLFRLADQAGLLADPELAAGRIRGFLESEGAA